MSEKMTQDEFAIQEALTMEISRVTNDQPIRPILGSLLKVMALVIAYNAPDRRSADQLVGAVSRDLRRAIDDVWDSCKDYKDKEASVN